MPGEVTLCHLSEGKQKQLFSNSTVELPGMFEFNSLCNVDLEVSSRLASTIHLCVSAQTDFPKPW